MDLVNPDLVARKEKYYENSQDQVKIVKFDSGKDVNTALAAGSIDASGRAIQQHQELEMDLTMT